jgi:hypothetical protein
MPRNIRNLFPLGERVVSLINRLLDIHLLYNSWILKILRSRLPATRAKRAINGYIRYLDILKIQDDPMGIFAMLQ